MPEGQPFRARRMSLSDHGTNGAREYLLMGASLMTKHPESIREIISDLGLPYVYQRNYGESS